MPLRPYQRDAVNFLISHPRSALFADPGLGKTLIVLALKRRLRLAGEMQRTLIVAPLPVCHLVWPEEIEQWGFDFSFRVLHGRSKNKPGRADVELVNFEGLKWFADRGDWAYDSLIIDESSRLKNPGSKRLKLLKPHLSKFKRRHILTGTPTPRSLMDLWAQFLLVDRGESLGKFITHFRNKYFYPIQRYNYFDWEPRKGSDKKIFDAIAGKTFRIDAESNLELPPLIENTIKLEFTPAVEKQYKTMEKELYAELESGEMLLASTAANKYLKCVQLTSGAIYNEEKQVLAVHDAKIKALKALIDELHQKPILIGYRFSHEGDRLRKTFSPHISIIDGKTSAPQTAEIVRKWNRGKVLILAAQCQAISHGLNLQKGGCADVCWFSLTDDFDVYEQFNRRIYRQGNVSEQVRIHHLLMRGTIDEVILYRLRNKDARQQGLFSFLADFWRLAKAP